MSGAIGDDSHQIATRIAQKLRDAKFSCQIATFVPADTVVLRRDRVAVILALALLTALAWRYLLLLSADMSMGGMDMGDFRMIPSGMGLMVPAHTPWQAMEFGFVFVMWTVMMVSMMTPSATPMILMYARAGRHAKAQGTPLAATVWFTASYFLVWIAFALLATMVQWALECTALLDSWMASTSNVLGGVVFLAVGSYQWTRLKDVCLAQCQKPFAFLMTHGGFRSDATGSLMLGLHHGAYCVGCCWALMAVLLVAGVMSPLWIAVLALVILLEKVTPFGRRIAFLAGMVLVAAGVWLFSIALQ
jgi:predicted metal-binding membrane protein